MAPTLPPAELSRRLRALRRGMRRERIGAVSLVHPANVHYYSGFTGMESGLLVTPSRQILFTDFRYREEAEESASGCEVVLWKDTLAGSGGAALRKAGCKRVGYEERVLPVNAYRALSAAAKGSRLIPWQDRIVEPRACKSEWEVRRIRKALRVSEAAFSEVRDWMRPGMRENDIAAELEYRMRRHGASGPAFPTIVAADANASLPHAHPGKRRIRRGGLVLIDFGACVAGYNSDLTRTLFVGSIPRPWKRRYHAVLEAQRIGIQSVAPANSGARADGAARSFLDGKGLGTYFGHSLGHGVGLEVHESPSLGKRQKAALSPGVVVTVEPGVYLPRAGGIRIEDMVLVTADGRRVLSRLPRSLEWAVIE